MDPFARRFTWNVIRRMRENRCIILTTHFMDEADLLGDTIAIMAEGQLRCVGSSLFLKKHYGVGYQLTIIKSSTQANVAQGEEEKEEEEEDTSNKLEKFALNAENGTALLNPGMKTNDTLENIVKVSVPSAKLLSNAGTEISFQLPIGDSAKFIEMFEKLEQQIKENNIESYGVSVTTLDEVFLMVARGEEGLPMSSERNDTTILDKGIDEPSSRSHRYSLDTTEQGSQFKSHVRALFAKRAKNFKRDKKAW